MNKLCRFRLGTLVITDGVDRVANADGYSEILQCVVKHVTGDWGVLDKIDMDMNESALIHGGRILSAYNLNDGTRIYIITEADRSSTTILLPSEY